MLLSKILALLAIYIFASKTTMTCQFIARSFAGVIFPSRSPSVRGLLQSPNRLYFNLIFDQGSLS